MEIALSPRTALCEEKLAKAREKWRYSKGKERKGATADNSRRFRILMILKEQNYSNQDMMVYYTTDHTKTQEYYMKIKGEQPEMKANNINRAKSANKDSDPIVNPMEKASTWCVKRLGIIPAIVTPLKNFVKAEESELAWAKRTTTEYATPQK